MNTINLLLSCFLLSYSQHLNRLKYDTTDRQGQVSLISFVVLLFIGVFIFYANINSNQPSDTFSVVLVAVAFAICFWMSIVAIRRFLFLLEKRKFESKLLKSPQEVIAYLASKNIYVSDRPVFLVNFQGYFFWHVGKNLLSADFLVSVDGDLYDPTIDYDFVEDECAELYYPLGFLGQAMVCLENKSFRDLKEIKKNYELIKKKECV